MKKYTIRRWLSVLLVLAMILSCVPVTLAAQEGVVVRYTFDDGTAADSSGNGYDGTLVQGATVADGSAKLIGGTRTAASGVDIPTAAFSGLTDYTIEMDVKLDETVNWTQLFTMGNGSNYLVLANEGNPSRVLVGLTMAAKLNGGTEQRVKSSSPSVKLPVGQWARMTYTQSGSTAVLYINGVPVGTSTITVTPGALAEKGLYGTIGRSLMFNDPGMKGLVDEFVLYNYGMTAAQVKESYDAKFGPILYYDFEDVTDGVVKDVTGNGYDATLADGAAVTEAMDGNALSLTTGSDYLSMPDFLGGLTDVTFSGFVKLDQRSVWTTIFAAGIQNGKCITVAAQGNPASNPVGFTLAINNGKGTEQRIAAASGHCIATGEWVHFVYTQDGTAARLYLDGVQVGSLSMVNNKFVDYGDNMTNTFADVANSGGPLMLGKSVWPDPDAYGLFDEIKVYDRALSQLEIQAITDEFALKIAYDALDLGDLSRVTSSLELPTEGAKGTTITWESDNPDVMDATGKLSANFEGEQTVTLTATISLNGQSMTKVFLVNVHPLSEEERAQLLLEEKTDYIEAAIDFLINDGYELPTIGDGAEVVYTIAEGDAEIIDGKVYKTETSAERQSLTLKATVTMGERSKEVELDNITLIDPYVGYILSFFGANGAVDDAHSGVGNKDEKFRMAYSYDGIHWAQLNNNYPVVYPEQGSTKRVRDPFIMRNKDGSFSVLATQGWDTPYIYIWYSENLTEFTNERLLQVSQTGVAGLTGARAWAPEADYDRITDQYYIYWADPSAGPIYYNTSADLETVSAPDVYFDPGYQVIDSNIVKDGDTYYMAFKDERSSGKRMKFAKSGSLEANTWEIYTPDFVTGMNSEGPFVYQDFNTGKWVMYWDFFYNGANERFGYSFTDDLASGQWDYQGTNPYMPSSDVRHGGVVPVTQKELDAILAKWETTDVRNVVQAAENTATVEGPVSFADLDLPETANMYLDNGQIVELPVTWSSEGYVEALGQQQLTGTVTLPEGYTNTNNVQPVLTLEVTEYTGATEADIVLRYDFEDIQGYTVTDTSGNGYDGTIVSSDSSIRTGIVGSALDIGNGYVSIPAEAIQGLTDVTVVAQVYIEDSAATANRTKPTTLFSAGYGNKQQAYFMINTQSFNLSQHDLLEGCGYTIHTPSFYEKRYAAPVDTVAVPGQWNTLVMTQRGTTVKFYLNGQLIFTQEDVTATMGDVYAGADTPVLLGGSVWNDAAPDGWYDSFTIYNRAMTDDQIPTGTGLVLDYQFEGMTAADTTVDDLSGNGYDGTLVSTDAAVVSGEFGDALDMGTGHVKIPAAAIQGLTDVTVVAQVYIDSRVSTGDVTKPTTLFSAGYADRSKSYFMLNTQSFDFGNYHEGCGYTIKTPTYAENRIAAPVESHAQEGQWNTIAMTQSGTTVKIYLNGELVRTEENVTATMGDVYAGEDTPVLLGGSVWGDYVPDGRYEYFRIYDRALAPEEIPLPQVETPVVVMTPFEETVDYIERAVDFLINDGSALPQSKDENFTVEWSLVSGDARIVDGKLCKTETSTERQAVVLQAVVTGEGESQTLTFEHVTLIDPYVGYVLSFFGAGGTVDEEHSDVNNKDEKFRMAYSYDGIHWAQLNSNFPVIYPESGNGRTRDPAIMRNKDGSFTVLATQGWDTPSIYLWHSEYLTEFTDERLLQATVKGPYGLTGSRAWAPEGTYDPITDRYFIYWSDPSANGSRGATYFNTSEDLQSLSEPGVLFDPGYRHLDANIIKYDGSYYLDFRHYSEYNVEGLSGIRFAMADRLAAGEFTAYTEDVNPYRTDSAAEGSFVFKVNGENKWYLYWDYNDIGKFGVMETTDLASGEWTYLGINQYMPHDNVRHGGATPVTQKELDAIIAKWETSSVRNVVQAAATTATVSGPAYFEDLTLPETANMYLDNGQIVELPVVWSAEGYEVKLGQQTLSGIVVLPEGYTNTDNVTAVLTLTVVADTQVPVITGVEEGKTYCDAQTVTVVDNNLAYVTVNGEKVSLVGSSFRTIPGALTIVATDLAGNTATVTITVNDGHTYLDTVAEPTCTQPGYTSHVCSNCGHSYVSDLVQAKGHSYEAQVTEPTHDMMGYTTHTCACGHSYIDTFVAALDHEYTRTVTKEATCTENGEVTFTCDCGESYTMILPRLDHSYTAETVEPTCESIGYTVYTCQCGHSYVGDLVEALGHDYESVVTAPTCVSMGYTTHTCDCGSTYVDAVTPALGHDYESVVTAPTHDAMGYTTHTCACGHSYVDAYTDALDHDFVKTVTKEATCTDEGVMTFTCECGESYTQPIPKADHSYTASVTEPTHTAMGYTTYTCDCGHSYVDALVPATGHSYEAIVTEATCGSVGYTTYVCACGDSFVDDLVPALGHSHEAVTTAPTCESWGYTTYTCVCGDNYISDLVPAAGHSYESVVAEPTCVSMGYTTHTCASCGDTYVDSLVDLLPHSHVGTVTTAATCTSEGVMTYTCACGDSYTQPIPKSDHDFHAQVTEPQCGLYGYTTYTCAACGFSYVSDMTPPLECPSLVFTDVVTGTWYHEGLDYVISRDLMRGISATEFAPHADTTRAMMATLLYRIAGEPSIEGLSNPFTDVAPGRYYTDAVIWAAHEGIVKGVSADTFAPNASVTREQMVTMLYRFAGSPETDANLSRYTDAAGVSQYARTAMAWAVETGIITGTTKTTLSPTGTATRAMIATVLMRFMEQ